MGRPRVLLADDHQAILDCASHQLADGFEIVATVLDGQAALAAILALEPDAVVLDISMPRMSGLEVAARLSKLPDPPRIVFLTVHDDPDFIKAAESAGAAGYVVKRNLCTQLVAALRHALNGEADATDAVTSP
jgi:DNA-binding NarL/FixJ family response regulator